VQAISVPGGIDYRLCDENIGSYSDLYFRTQDIGGSLIRVYQGYGKTHRGATFTTTGSHIGKAGLAMGDTLIVGYDYGIIKVRKIYPEKLGYPNIKVIPLTYITHKYTGDPIPKVFLSGYWLDSVGFKIGAVATAKAEPGILTLKLQDPDTDYRAFMKYVRWQGMKIVQVAKESHNRGEPRPCIGITGSCVANAGFSIGDVLVVSYEHGTIKFQTPDFEKLGFC